MSVSGSRDFRILVAVDPSGVNRFTPDIQLDVIIVANGLLRSIVMSHRLSYGSIHVVHTLVNLVS